MDLDAVVWGMRLVWWLVIGIVVLGLLLLVLAAVPLLRRLSRLRRTGERLRRHQAAIDAVQNRALELQRRSEEVAVLLTQVQARVDRIAGRRDRA